MAKSGADQHQRRVSVRKAAHHTGAPADFPVQPFYDIVGANSRPMLRGEVCIGQSFFHAVLNLFCRLLQFHSTKFCHHCRGLLTSRFFVLLGMDGLEHFSDQFHLGFGNHREHVAVKVHHAALVFGLWKHFSHGLQHTKALVPDDEFHAIQAASFEPLEEVDPAGLVFFHSLGSTQNLTITVLIDRDCHQNGHIFVFSAPVAAQIDPVHIDIRITTTLQRTVAPIFNVDIRLFVQFTNGGWRDLAAPQGLGDILYTPDGDTG